MSGELQEAPLSSHYKKMGVEPIEVIEMWNMDFHLGNALKYIGRWGLKNGLDDLRKAVWYIERRIRLEEMKQYAEVAKDPGPAPAFRTTTGTATAEAVEIANNYARPKKVKKNARRSVRRS